MLKSTLIRHTLAAQIGQTNTLVAISGKVVHEAYVDLGYRGVDADNPGVRVMHRGRIKSMTKLEKEAAEATPGGGAGDWAREARSSDEPLSPDRESG